jgi:hypothetical protein
MSNLSVLVRMSHGIKEVIRFVTNINGFDNCLFGRKKFKAVQSQKEVSFFFFPAFFFPHQSSPHISD